MSYFSKNELAKITTFLIKSLYEKNDDGLRLYDVVPLDEGNTEALLFNLINLFKENPETYDYLQSQNKMLLDLGVDLGDLDVNQYNSYLNKAS